jgi:hypothetical protein
LEANQITCRRYEVKNKYLPLFVSSCGNTDGVGARCITVSIVKVSATQREGVAFVFFWTVSMIAEDYIASGLETVGSRSINTSTLILSGSGLARAGADAGCHFLAIGHDGHVIRALDNVGVAFHLLGCYDGKRSLVGLGKTMSE